MRYQIPKRRRLPRRIRAGRSRESLLRNGSQLRGLGERLRPARRRGRRPGRGPGIQPHSVQHAARHLPLRLAHGVQQRLEGRLGPGQGPLLHHPDGQGRLRAGVGGGVLENPPRRAEHGGDAPHGGPLAPPERPADAGVGYPASPPAVMTSHATGPTIIIPSPSKKKIVRFTKRNLKTHAFYQKRFKILPSIVFFFKVLVLSTEQYFWHGRSIIWLWVQDIRI